MTKKRWSVDLMKRASRPPPSLFFITIQICVRAFVLQACTQYNVAILFHFDTFKQLFDVLLFEESKRRKEKRT